MVTVQDSQYVEESCCSVPHPTPTDTKFESLAAQRANTVTPAWVHPEPGSGHGDNLTRFRTVRGLVIEAHSVGCTKWMDQAFQPTHACTDVSGRVAGDGLLHPRVASGQDNHGSCCEGCGNGSRGGIRGCRV